jgi:hypothetical protein
MKKQNNEGFPFTTERIPNMSQGTVGLSDRSTNTINAPSNEKWSAPFADFQPSHGKPMCIHFVDMHIAGIVYRRNASLI